MNKNLISEKEFSFIKEEFSLLPVKEIDGIFIKDSLFEILEYVYHENNWKKVVNQSQIIKKFNISKVTTMKRLNELIDEGLIFIRDVGREKQIKITLKGKNFIESRISDKEHKSSNY